MRWDDRIHWLVVLLLTVKLKLKFSQEICDFDFHRCNYLHMWRNRRILRESETQGGREPDLVYNNKMNQ